MSSHAASSQPSSDPRKAQPSEMESPPTSHDEGPSSTKAAASNSTCGVSSEIHKGNGGIRETETEKVFLRRQKMMDLLFENVMKGEWENVIDIYKSHHVFAHMAQITSSEETALHVAISLKKIRVAKKLLHTVDDEAIRQMINDRGENPLHLAASFGLVEICKLIVHKDSNLIKARNVVGETPLFLAALHGWKGAFYALHTKCPALGYIKHDLEVCRRNSDGNTILHVAIQGEHFDLAIQIINWYPDFCNKHNQSGESPLHLLACKPSTFRSGSHLRPLEDLIYRYCISIDPVKLEHPSDYVDEYRLDDSTSVPENYRTCWNVLKMFVHLARGWRDDTIDAAKEILPVQCIGVFQAGDDLLNYTDEQDLEAPRRETAAIKGKAIKGKATKLCSHAHIAVVEETQLPTSEEPNYPPNYYTFFHFLQGALELFILFIGLGCFRVGKIKETKRRHTFALQVMKNLVARSTVWKYRDNVLRTSISKTFPGGPPDTHSEQESEGEEGIRAVDRKAYGKRLEVPMQSQMKDIREDMEKSMPEIKELEGKKVQEEAEKAQSYKMQVQPEKAQPDVYNLQMLSTDSQENDSSPFLIAAKMGVKEIVEEIFNKFPVAIWDRDADKKNVVLLVAENKHPKIYEFLLKECPHMESLHKMVDKKSNNALHLAATIQKNQHWRIPGVALQMQSELKWFKCIKSSLPRHFITLSNGEGKTPRDVFTETHEGMVKDGREWLKDTSTSCSVVAALIATVAFASATTVPGSVKETTGVPNVTGQSAFDIFTISSLVALGFSIISLIMFLSILTSRYHNSDFLWNLPIKLMLGLTCLFVSIAAMLVSVSAGYSFVLGDQFRHRAVPIYVITSVPVTIYGVVHFPLYFDLIKSTITAIPKRSY